MLVESTPSMTTENKIGFFKVDNETLTVINDSLRIKDSHLVSQMSSPDEELQRMIDEYYNGYFTLADIQSVQAIGDARQGNDIDKINFKITSHSTPAGMAYYGNTSSGSGTVPELKSAQIIIDFNHDILKESINNITKALITIQMKGCSTFFEISPPSSNYPNDGGMLIKNGSNGQSSSYIYSYYSSSFFQNCNFKNNIKIVIKKTYLNYNSNIITDCENTFFLLSEKEVFDNITYSKGEEGTQYPYFLSSSNRIKRKGQRGSASASECNQQLRSISSTNSLKFCYVSTLGQVNENESTSSFFAIPACAL